jgi:hypothetical protein
VRASNPESIAVDREPFDVHLAGAAFGQLEMVAKRDAVVLAIIAVRGPHQALDRRGLVARGEQRAPHYCDRGDVLRQRRVDVREACVRLENEA